MRERFAAVVVSLTALGISVVCGISFGVGSRQIPQQNPAELQPAPNHALTRMVLPGTEELQLIVELTGPPVVELIQRDRTPGLGIMARAAGRPSRLDLRSAQAAEHREQVAEQQRQVADRLARIPDARVEGRLDSVLNALVVRVPPEEYEQVRNLPGVKKVYFSRPLRMLLDTSSALLNAQDMWSASGGRDQAGKGLKIGIIDTGIDITNPMFDDSGMTAPPGYPKGESGYTNKKVLVARNYLKLLPGQQTIQTALDEIGHGTFVAGAAAGRFVSAPLANISGMAPGAYLGSYKVFGTPGINDFTTTAALLAAINDAVADGMDVLNLSLGALDYLPPAEDPEIGALQNAIKSGVVVVAAAGNDGPSPHTIENPGAAPDVIAVGSVTNSRIFAAHVHVTTPVPVPSILGSIPYLSGDGPVIDKPIASTGIVDVTQLDGTGQSCDPLPAGSLQGSIALVVRKPCTFATKVANAQAAGATAVIIYNNNPTEGPVLMAGLTSSAIPAMMISNAVGDSLKQYIAENPGQVLVGVDSRHMLSSTPAPSRILSTFSSTGPGTDFSVKPDLVAVGENVYSAAQTTNSKGVIYSPDGFFLGSGTSFSTPMVAGSAADVMRLFPQFSALDVKSALVNTARQAVTVDGTNAASVIQSGSGLLDMGGASGVGAVFAPTSLNFGARSYGERLSLTKTFTIKNISSITDSYLLSVQPGVAGPITSLSQDLTGPVPPGGSTSVDLTLQVSAPQSGGFQGFVAIQSKAGGLSYRVPYWAGLFVPDRSRVLTVSRSSAAASSFSSIAAALNAAQPGNVIEIADSGTYAAGLTIGTNAQGLPLDGITIRAAAGQTPTLDGSSVFTSPGNIRIVGLRNVLLQGLKISGGITGLLLTQSSTSAPLSVTIDHCVIDATSGAGIVAFSGATVDVTKSTISNSQGTGIVAIGGSLTLSGSTVINNAADGIDALGVNLTILGSTVSGNTGPGLNSVGSSGSVESSNFSSNHGSLGDGMEVVNGAVTISGNTFDSNDRAGVAYFAGGNVGAGATGKFMGNVVRSNRSYGVLIGAGQSLRFDGNLIKDNGCGFSATGFATATLTNNIVLRSVDPTSGNGIWISGNSAIRIVNNTVYGNAVHGILVDPTASAVVYNSIVSKSGRGDIQGLTATKVGNSLVGDGSFSGNGNVTGDPMFSDANHEDFGLQAGSPAVGIGTRAAPDLPFLDFNHRLRSSANFQRETVFDGSVDAGAIQTNSLYPLSFPLFAHGSQPALGTSVTTGIAVLNSGAISETVGFAGFDPEGEMLETGSDPVTESLDPQSQIPRLDYQLFGFDSQATVMGSIMTGATQPLAGFLLLFDSNFNRFATGVSVSGGAETDLVFMRHLADATGKAAYVVFNPGTNPALVTATYFSIGGGTGPAKTATIVPKGQYLFNFDEVSSSSGYVTIASGRPVSGLEVYGSSQGLTALPAMAQGTQSRLFFPHVAQNQGFSTQIGIVNTNASPVDLVLTAYGDNGNVIGTPAVLLLDARSQVLDTAANLFGLGGGSLQTGYVVAQGDQPGIMGFTAFTHSDGSRQVTAALPTDSVPRQHLLFSHIAHQVPAADGETYQTAVGLLNPYGTEVSYTVSVYDGKGNLGGQTSGVLGPHQKIAKYLSHAQAGAGFFDKPMSLGSGHIDISSDYGLFGLELFFTENFSQLAAVAAQMPPDLK